MIIYIKMNVETAAPEYMKIYIYIYNFLFSMCIFHLHIDISTIQFIQCVDSTDPFVRFSYNKEPCTELIEFARAACRDDMEDGITAPRCPVITALNRIKSRNTEAWLDSTCIYMSKFECSYLHVCVLKGLLFFFWANLISNIDSILSIPSVLL